MCSFPTISKQRWETIYMKTKKYKCDACNKIFELNVEDERCLFEQIECDNCGALAKTFIDKTEVVGDIEEVESRGENINF